jgi:hypothetical protein
MAAAAMMRKRFRMCRNSWYEEVASTRAPTGAGTWLL